MRKPSGLSTAQWAKAASANPDGDQQLSFLGAADTEGIEEITGNYKP